jgi:hypothetical protein
MALVPTQSHIQWLQGAISHHVPSTMALVPTQSHMQWLQGALSHPVHNGTGAHTVSYPVATRGPLPSCPQSHWCPRSLIFSGYKGPFPSYKSSQRSRPVNPSDAEVKKSSRGASMSHNPMGLFGLLQIYLHFYLNYTSTPPRLHGVMLN